MTTAAVKADGHRAFYRPRHCGVRIRVFVETPKGRDSAGFTVPKSAAAADVLMALRSRGWSPFALRLDLEQNAWIALVMDWRRAA
jgi:hypothetical protein